MGPILFLDQSGQLGGAELSLLDIAEHFKESCLVTTFESGPFPELLAERNIPHVIEEIRLRYSKEGSGLSQLAASLPALLSKIIRITKLAREHRLICANTPKAAVLGGIVSLLSGKPFVYHLRDILSPEHFSRNNLRILIGISNRCAKAVICNSEATREAFVQSGGRSEIARIVYNGIDANSLATPEAEHQDRLRQSLYGKQKTYPKVALIAGRLSSWKGQDVFIDALAQVPKLHGLIVGDALFTNEDQLFAKQLQEQVGSLALGDRVQFLGFRTDMPALYHLADIIVHCSTAPEPFGRVIVEGMLCRKPVIATNHGGATEILNDGETGLLVPPGDQEALASAMQRLLQDALLRTKLADAAYNDAVSRFSLERVLEQMETVFREVETG